MTRTREEMEAELKKVHYHDELNPFVRGARLALIDKLKEMGDKLGNKWLDGETEELFEENTND